MIAPHSQGRCDRRHASPPHSGINDGSALCEERHIDREDGLSFRSGSAENSFKVGSNAMEITVFLIVFRGVWV